MATLTHGSSPTANSTTATTFLFAALREVARVPALLLRAWRNRQASIALRSLGPDMLRDIGIERCEIDWVVRNGRADKRAMMPARDLGV